MPGHHTNCLALSWHFVMPWCPEWSFYNISVCIKCGVTMHNPQSNKPFWTDSSGIHVLNCLTGSCGLHGQPSLENRDNNLQVLSSSCAFHSCIKHLSVAGKLFKMRLTYASESICNISSVLDKCFIRVWDKASAMTSSLPGMCTIVN